MIKNNRQLKYTKRRLRQLEQELDAVHEKYSSNKNKTALLSQGLMEHIAQLKTEIAEDPEEEVTGMKKDLTLKEVVSGELKNKQFKRYYEEEGRRLTIGYKIAKLRHKLGLTQKELARKVHTSQATVARLESGDYKGYNLRTLEKIVLATGIHLDIKFS